VLAKNKKQKNEKASDLDMFAKGLLEEASS